MLHSMEIIQTCYTEWKHVSCPEKALSPAGAGAPAGKEWPVPHSSRGMFFNYCRREPKKEILN